LTVALAAVGMVSSASVWTQSANTVAEKEKEAEVSSNAVVTITGVRRAAPFDFKGLQYSVQAGVKHNDKAGKTARLSGSEDAVRDT
jgi:hypothetical protein